MRRRNYNYVMVTIVFVCVAIILGTLFISYKRNKGSNKNQSFVGSVVSTVKNFFTGSSNKQIKTQDANNTTSPTPDPNDPNAPIDDSSDAVPSDVPPEQNAQNSIDDSNTIDDSKNDDSKNDTDSKKVTPSNDANKKNNKDTVKPNNNKNNNNNKKKVTPNNNKNNKKKKVTPNNNNSNLNNKNTYPFQENPNYDKYYDREDESDDFLGWLFGF